LTHLCRRNTVRFVFLKKNEFSSIMEEVMGKSQTRNKSAWWSFLKRKV
jgi:hypothetical protein